MASRHTLLQRKPSWVLPPDMYQGPSISSPWHIATRYNDRDTWTVTCCQGHCMCSGRPSHQPISQTCVPTWRTWNFFPNGASSAGAMPHPLPPHATFFPLCGLPMEDGFGNTRTHPHKDVLCIILRMKDSCHRNRPTEIVGGTQGLV